MKKNIVFISFILLAFSLQAQLPIWSFYHSHSRGDGVTKFTIPGLLIKTGALFIPEKEGRSLVKKLGTIRILVAEGQYNAFGTGESKRLVKRLHRNNFEDLIAIKDGDERVNIMVKERRGKIRRYLLFVNDKDDSVLISGRCKLGMDDFLKMVKENTPKVKAKIKIDTKKT
jgi:hypothetical protein